MIVVLAAREDVLARELVARLRKEGVRAELMLCADVGRRGWRVTDVAEDDRAVIGSRTIAASEIAGVVTRLPAVTPAELPQVHADDRAYAASEMHAFLLAWLQSLRCPVLNRPHPGSLAGVPWAIEEWLALGSRQRIAVRTVRRRWSPAGAQHSDWPSELHSAHVVGDRCFGAADERTAKAAVKLAKAAKAELLRVLFERAGEGAEPTLVGADHWVDVRQPGVAAAIVKRCAS